MLRHNLTIAVRNLSKYKIQTVISVLSIAVGITTLSFIHSLLLPFVPYELSREPYYERVYSLWLEENYNPDKTDNVKWITQDMISALNKDTDNGSIERTSLSTHVSFATIYDISLGDSLHRKGELHSLPISPEMPNFQGIRSAITGDNIRILKDGELIMSERQAKKIFGDTNPIGATMTTKILGQEKTFTLVDVFEIKNITENQLNIYGTGICFGDVENFDATTFSHYLASSRLFVVAREGFTRKQFEAEVNKRLAPFTMNFKFRISNLSEDEAEDIAVYNAVQVIGRLVGSLVLLAAIIGFLRMQAQLFHMRRREMAIRTINGGKQHQLFTQLLTEASITIIAAVVLAVFLGDWLTEYITTTQVSYLEVVGVYITPLWQASIPIGIVLIAACAVMVWFTLRRLRKERDGLAAAMRKSHRHIFRNIMLGIQIAISIFFLCITLVLTQGIGAMLKPLNIPGDETPFKESVYLKPTNINIPLAEELSRLPEVEETALYIDKSYSPLVGYWENPEFLKKSGKRSYFPTRFVDSLFLSRYQVDVTWLKGNYDRNDCILVQDELFGWLNECGLSPGGGLTVYKYGRGRKEITLPVAGTFKAMPYERSDYQGIMVVVPNPGPEEWAWGCTLLAKPGEYNNLMDKAEATFRRLEPEAFESYLHNFHVQLSSVASLLIGVRSGGWIVALVSLLICIMSIYSTITLDTRARRKEMAIRKINGAKPRDIARIFARLYIVLIIPALAIALPCVSIFADIIYMMDDYKNTKDLSPALPMLLGTLAVIITIVVIVSWQVRKIMRVNPTEIIEN